MTDVERIAKRWCNSQAIGGEMVGYASPTIVRPDAADLELARRSRLE